MAYMEWDERMNVGNETIDVQHKQLVVLINDIAEATERGASRKELGGLIRSFCDFSAEHFRTEQALMDSTDYPHYFEQVGGHEDCAAQALDFYRGYINGEDLSVADFLVFVSTWFTSHTLGVDQTLRPYLRKKAAAAKA